MRYAYYKQKELENTFYPLKKIVPLSLLEEKQQLLYFFVHQMIYDIDKN